jgi:uncharacterized protein (TIGR00255 family)
MILSMTGFGDAVLEQGSRRYHLEIRTVNNRYFKSSIRLPEQLGFLENTIDRVVRGQVARGSVSVHLHVHFIGAEGAAELNRPVLERYIAQLLSAAGEDGRVTIDASRLVDMPGVMEPHEMTDAERSEAEQVVVRLVEEALEKLVAMRREEGKSLLSDLDRQCQSVRDCLARVRERAPAVVQEYRERLTARVKELLDGRGVSIAQDDLIKEVSIFAERSDINEEVSRLGSHLDQFAECMGSGEPAGRKLDFIAQEMFREANTIGSKASDNLIAREIVEIKGSIDRIKEQVQNAE